MKFSKVFTFAFILLFSLILLWACELVESPVARTTTSLENTTKSLKDIVAAGKIPSKSQLGTYNKAVQDIFRPLAAAAEKDLGVIYVTVNGGSTLQNGTSWRTAYPNPKAAIDEAGSKANGQKPYLVLLASGTYTVSATLNMKNHVAIVGGITSNFLASTTTLDGSNTKQMFTNFDLDNTAVLYDVTITNSTAKYGGGMYNISSSPTLNQVIFSDNTANYGGAMYNADSSPTLSQVTFSANSASRRGGGMYNINSSPTLSQATFSANTATSSGGGMYNGNSSSPTLSQATFSANTASDNGGGMYNANSSSPTLSQVTFSANTATRRGGGMYNDTDGATGPTIINSIFWGNTQGQGTANVPSQFYTYNQGNFEENMQIYYSIVQGTDEGFLKFNPSGGATVTITQYGVIGTNPNLSALAGNGGFVQTMALGSDSLAIDAGIYVRKSGSSYYYSSDASTWYTSITNSGFDTSNSASLPTGAIDLTATDARGHAVEGRPDLGAYEFGTRILPPKDPTLKGVVKARKIPAKSRLSTYDKAVQDIFNPLAGVTEKDLGVIYVTVRERSITRDGTSWDTAYINPKTAIDEAGNKANDQKPYLVLLAGGTYIVSATPNMKNHVAIVGGITSTFLPSKTTLDGGRMTRAFFNSNIDNTAVLYDVTITNGRAQYAGGMYNINSSPTLSQVTFSDNTAIYGGAMYNADSSSPTLSQVTFSDNTATQHGGGIYNINSSPTLSQATFSDNTANYGGGMYNGNSSSPTLSKATFSANTASGNGGGMYNGNSSSPTLSQVTFSENTATRRGGGMYNDTDGATGPTIINSIFWGNTQGQGTDKKANQFYTYNQGNLEENMQIYYSIVQGANEGFLKFNPSGAAAVTITQFGIVGTDPNLSALGSNGGYVQTLALGSNSPAIDAGIYVRKKGSSYYYSSDASTWYTTLNANGFSTSTSLPSGAIDLTTTDARGHAIEGRPDLGAYEFGIRTSYTHPEGPKEPVTTIIPPTTTTTIPPTTTTIIPPTTGTLKTLKDVVKVLKIPARSQLSTYDKAVQDIFRPLAAAAEKDLGVVYVTVSGGSTTKDGTSWDTAYDKSNVNLVVYRVGRDANDQKPYLVLLAGGTYSTVGQPIFMKKNVAIVGGITSTFLPSNTILDGGRRTRIFDNQNLDNTAVLYGVTITNGRADKGGGMYNNSSSPTLSQVIFLNNRATLGGGIFNQNSSSPTLNQVTFSGNLAYGNGGGMYNNYSSSPTLSQATFSDNTAKFGGGMHNENSSPALSRVIFSANTAEFGGGMHNENSSPALSQVTFSRNVATAQGGGIYNDGSSSPTLKQVTFSNNEPADEDTN